MFGFKIDYDVKYLKTLVIYEYQLTPEELAGIIGYSRGHIYKVLNHSQKPTDRFIHQIISGLKLNLVDQFRLKYSMSECKARILADHFKQLDHHALLTLNNY